MSFCPRETVDGGFGIGARIWAVMKYRIQLAAQNADGVSRLDRLLADGLVLRLTSGPVLLSLLLCYVQAVIKLSRRAVAFLVSAESFLCISNTSPKFN